MKNITKLLTLSFIGFSALGHSQTYPIVDTDVTDYYSNDAIISAPSVGQAFYGQDANYNGNQPSYTDNFDGTITDNVTGLMWEKDMGTKISYADAFIKASNSSVGGHNDWRVPTIKELYSLAQFHGRCLGDFAMYMFIDTNYFVQPIGDTGIGEREIDGQTWSSNQYVGLTMNGDTTVFGFNFVDGRLKGYPKYDPQSGNPKTMYFRMVRENPQYGINDFTDNSDGTITDNATGLMWQQADDGTSRNWENSLTYAENLSLAGHDDWRMPNAKELHSILDYTRCPDVTNSPAIDPLFSCTSFNNPDGDPNYGYYWTSSPLMDGPSPYTDAVYMCFGEAQGEMSLPPSFTPTIYDTHGAGASRNDPKEMASGTTYPTYFGPQGDIVYVNNYIRCVRDVGTTSIDEKSTINFNMYPNPVKDQLTIVANSNKNTISIYNIIGEKMIEQVSNQKKTTLNTTQLPNGVYLVNLVSENGKTISKKITISK